VLTKRQPNNAANIVLENILPWAQRETYQQHRGEYRKFSENMSKLKKYKNIHLFQFFKHLKQPPPSSPFVGKYNSE